MSRQKDLTRMPNLLDALVIMPRLLVPLALSLAALSLTRSIAVPEEVAIELSVADAPGTDTLVKHVERQQGPTISFEPTATESELPERFQLTSHVFPFQTLERPKKTLEWGPKYEVTFPSPVTTAHECNNTVHCEYFPPLGQATGKRPGVIVLHILGGDFELSRVCCRSLSLNGIGALFVKMPYYGPRRPANSQARMISSDLDQTVAGMTQAVLDIRRAAAWLAAREEIDGSRLGITGISLGGIVGALAASAEPRFTHACLVLAGGNLERIILESEETKAIREEWANREFDVEEIRAKLRSVDPLTYAAQLKNRKVLMFNAKHDDVVPPDCTDALWKAIGQPEIHWWNANHYSAAWYLPVGLVQMGKFFQAD
jgi:dienelactone hydrolase